jgi:hypothetical protein
MAHCSLCGQLLAASPDRPITERLAAGHLCQIQMQLPKAAGNPR